MSVDIFLLSAAFWFGDDDEHTDLYDRDADRECAAYRQDGGKRAGDHVCHGGSDAGAVSDVLWGGVSGGPTGGDPVRHEGT